MNEQERVERRQRIHAAYAATGSIRSAVRQTGYSINTVRLVLRGQDEPQPPSARPRRPSKLDAFAPLIRGLVLEEQLSAVLIFEELRSLGFEGSYTLVKEHVRRLRPRPKVRVTTRLEHPAGEEGQVDWSPYSVALGGERCVVHAFSTGAALLALPGGAFRPRREARDAHRPSRGGLQRSGGCPQAHDVRQHDHRGPSRGRGRDPAQFALRGVHPLVRASTFTFCRPRGRLCTAP